jgi:thiol peroxidase
MATTQLKGNPVALSGDFPVKDAIAKKFTAVQQDLSEISSDAFQGKKMVLNIFPSIDTDVCATSVRKFNERAAALENTQVICLSADLPFAHKRFCGAEGIENLITASLFRNQSFAVDYGVLIADGPLKGLTARAVIVVGETGTILYAQLVDDITHEPDYEAALAALA